MARSSGKGNQALLLLILLGILVGGGSWNYMRNLKLEEEGEPRPYRSYSFEQLDALRAAYQQEVDSHTQRYRTASSRKVKVRGGGLIADQVNEFERVQRISQSKRDIANQYARNRVQLDGILAELSHRAAESEPVKLFLKRLTKYP